MIFYRRRLSRQQQKTTHVQQRKLDPDWVALINGEIQFGRQQRWAKQSQLCLKWSGILCRQPISKLVFKSGSIVIVAHANSILLSCQKHWAGDTERGFQCQLIQMISMQLAPISALLLPRNRVCMTFFLKRKLVERNNGRMFFELWLKCKTTDRTWQID